MDMFSALIASFRQIAETGGPVVVVLMGVAVLTLAVAHARPVAVAAAAAAMAQPVRARQAPQRHRGA